MRQTTRPQHTRYPSNPSPSSHPYQPHNTNLCIVCVFLYPVLVITQTISLISFIQLIQQESLHCIALHSMCISVSCSCNYPNYFTHLIHPTYSTRIIALHCIALHSMCISVSCTCNYPNDELIFSFLTSFTHSCFFSLVVSYSLCIILLLLFLLAVSLPE